VYVRVRVSVRVWVGVGALACIHVRARCPPSPCTSPIVPLLCPITLSRKELLAPSNAMAPCPGMCPCGTLSPSLVDCLARMPAALHAASTTGCLACLAAALRARQLLCMPCQQHLTSPHPGSLGSRSAPSWVHHYCWCLVMTSCAQQTACWLAPVGGTVVVCHSTWKHGEAIP